MAYDGAMAISVATASLLLEGAGKWLIRLYLLDKQDLVGYPLKEAGEGVLKAALTDMSSRAEAKAARRLERKLMEVGEELMEAVLQICEQDTRLPDESQESIMLEFRSALLDSSITMAGFVDAA